jgi:DNA repair protein RadA/Sms
MWYRFRLDGRKVVAKTVLRYVCRDCGVESPRWLGRCQSCEAWNTLEELSASLPVTLKSSGRAPKSSVLAQRNRPSRLDEIPSSLSEGRSTTGIGEFDRVLGGGVVGGAIILIGGDPGIGKSTLLTQTAGFLAIRDNKTLYVSGEESIGQIKRRIERLSIRSSSHLLLQNETDITVIEATVREEQPAFVIIDSIQTMQHPDADSLPGSVTQVRACTALLTQLAKSESIGIFLVGHVTKEGTLAGPRVLEHMVDAVLSFEGDRHSIYRILRANKNRFGSTDELGIFQMDEHGLIEISNPSEMLLSERLQNAVGSAVTATVEGTRPLLLEVQALIAPSVLANPRRSVIGMDTNRVHMILAVLEKRAGLTLAYQDVFINIVGGVRIDEPAADLAVALAAASHRSNVAVDAETVAIGEIGLAGEVRAVSQVEKRIRESARLGFKRVIISSKNKHTLRMSEMPDIRIVGVDHVGQAIDAAVKKPG